VSLRNWIWSKVPQSASGTTMVLCWAKSAVVMAYHSAWEAMWTVRSVGRQKKSKKVAVGLTRVVESQGLLVFGKGHAMVEE
jgi:hypothetical protein